LARQVCRKNGGKNPDTSSGHQDAHYSGGKRERERFGEELLDESASPGAEGASDGQFFAAGGDSRHN
jgi:hypothetical protein